MIFGIGSNFKNFNSMIWAILYFIGIVICYGSMLYIYNDITFDEPEILIIWLLSLFWPILLIIAITHGLSYCIKLLLTKIFKNK